jgi:hypothetical protein
MMDNGVTTLEWVWDLSPPPLPWHDWIGAEPAFTRTFWMGGGNSGWEGVTWGRRRWPPGTQFSF